MSDLRPRSTLDSFRSVRLVLVVTLALLAFAGCVDAPPPTPTAVATMEAAAPQAEAPTSAPAEEETPEAATAEPETPEPEPMEPETAEPEPADSETAEPVVAESETAEPETAEEGATEDAQAAQPGDDVTSAADASAFNTWNVTELYDFDTLGGVTVTVQLLSESELSGWTGCNDFEAAYTAGDGAFELTDLVLTSENECSSETETAQEMLFQEAMTDARTYELSGAELTLFDAAGAPVAVMRNAVTLDLIGTTWNVTGYRDASGSFVPPVEDGPVLNLILRQDAVSGFSGCANFEGTAEVSGNAIAIDNLTYDVVGLGTQECEGSSPLSNQDAEYRKTLTTAATWQIDGPQMILSDDAGEPVVTYDAAGAEQNFLP